MGVASGGNTNRLHSVVLFACNASEKTVETKSLNGGCVMKSTKVLNGDLVPKHELIDAPLLDKKTSTSCIARAEAVQLPHDLWIQLHVV